MIGQLLTIWIPDLSCFRIPTVFVALKHRNYSMLNHLKTRPFEIWPSKNLEFKCFRISNGLISDPHCSLVIKCSNTLRKRNHSTIRPDAFTIHIQHNFRSSLYCDYFNYFVLLIILWERSEYESSKFNWKKKSTYPHI